MVVRVLSSLRFDPYGDIAPNELLRSCTDPIQEDKAASVHGECRLSASRYDACEAVNPQ